LWLIDASLAAATHDVTDISAPSGVWPDQAFGHHPIEPTDG
jgi:hypothetical protein